jgi:hypothetical protein
MFIKYLSPPQWARHGAGMKKKNLELIPRLAAEKLAASRYCTALHSSAPE